MLLASSGGLSTDRVSVACSAAALSEAAAAAEVTLVGGSIPERSASRLYNTCLVYDARGALLAKHRKVRTAPTVQKTFLKIDGRRARTHKANKRFIHSL